MITIPFQTTTIFSKIAFGTRQKDYRILTDSQENLLLEIFVAKRRRICELNVRQSSYIKHDKLSLCTGLLHNATCA
jgi:hypothetical protein